MTHRRRVTSLCGLLSLVCISAAPPSSLRMSLTPEALSASADSSDVGPRASIFRRGPVFTPSPRLLSVNDVRHTPLKGVTPMSSDTGVYNVLDYGAKADNSTDNTQAFTAAMAAAVNASGGLVFAPAGQYVFAGVLAIPPSVTLRGSFATVPSHDMRPAKPPPAEGTVFHSTANHGNSSGRPFITVSTDATAAGFVVYYPKQSRTELPVEYPYTLALVGPNAAVTDIELLNSYNGVSAVQAHRHYIARIQGQPTNIGVLVDETYDIGRIEDVHFNPWYSCRQPYLSHQLIDGRAFVFGRSDWEYVFNTFAFAQAVGYHFIQTPTGAMNGNFQGLGADYCVNASVLVEQSQAPGLLFSNFEGTAFSNSQFGPTPSTADSSQVVVLPSNVGPVRFVDSSFWGPCDSIARLGAGTSSFTGCSFVQWDLRYKKGSPCIHVTGGNVILSANEFQQPGRQVVLESNVSKAVILGNIITGPLNITNNIGSKAQMGFNAAD